MTTQTCDIFRTVFTESGVVPIFEIINRRGITETRLIGEPISLEHYAEFLDSETAKLNKDKYIPYQGSPLVTNHYYAFTNPSARNYSEKFSPVVSVEIMYKKKKYKVHETDRDVWIKWHKQQQQLTIEKLSALAGSK